MFQDEVVEQLHLPAVLTRELKITAFYSAGPGSLVYLDIIYVYFYVLISGLLAEYIRKFPIVIMMFIRVYITLIYRVYYIFNNYKYPVNQDQK